MYQRCGNAAIYEIDNVMTSPKYGQITPLQAYILHLSGVISGVPDEFVQEQDRVDSMRRALKKLQKKLGKILAMI